MNRRMTFIGEYECKADSKNRVMIPAVFRKQLSVSNNLTMILQKSVVDDCLDLFPFSEWEKNMDELRSKLNMFDKKHVAFFREFCRGTHEIELDSNGRVLLPKKTLELIGVEKEMLFVGLDAKMQIWNSTVYEGKMMDAKSISNLAAEIFK